MDIWNRHRPYVYVWELVISLWPSVASLQSPCTVFQLLCICWLSHSGSIIIILFVLMQLTAGRPEGLTCCFLSTDKISSSVARENSALWVFLNIPDYKQNRDFVRGRNNTHYVICVGFFTPLPLSTPFFWPHTNAYPFTVACVLEYLVVCVCVGSL